MRQMTPALDTMVTEKTNEVRPDLIVSDSIAYWGKLAAMKHRIPYVSSTTTFAFNKYSAKYIKHGLGETMRMLFSMPRVHKQIKRLQEKGYPVKGILDIVQNYPSLTVSNHTRFGHEVKKAEQTGG